MSLDKESAKGSFFYSKKIKKFYTVKYFKKGSNNRNAFLPLIYIMKGEV